MFLSGRLAQLMDVQRFRDDFANGHPRVERSVRVLEDHLGLAAKTGEIGNRLAGKLNRSSGGLNESEQGPPERRFAAAAFPDQTDTLAFLNSK